MELNTWTKNLRALYDKALEQYRSGQRGADTFFNKKEVGQLKSIGLRPINLYDYVEDFLKSGEPDWDTVLLIVATRRDYFLHEMKGEAAPREITNEQLPAKPEELEGVPWLPRIIRKAQGYLEGSLEEDIMYCCGGDRRFLKERGLHPADFLRVVWAARGDEQKVLAFVKKG